MVVYHAAVYLERVRGHGELHAFAGGRLGVYGVVTFFVISGYLMADLVTRYASVTFLVHRLIRIYPIYWLCVVLAAVYYVALWHLSLPDAGHVPVIHHMLAREGILPDTLRLLLVPFRFPDFPLGVEWTLLYETSFYMLIFAVSLARMQRWLLPLSVSWLGVIVCATLLNPASQAGYTQPTISSLLLFQINAGFIFGIVANACMTKRVRLPSGYLGVAMLLCSELVSGRWQMLSISLSLGLIVLGLLQWESALKGTFHPWRSGVLLGNWSYALYLIHVPVILGVMKLAGSDLSPYALFSAAIGTSLVAAALVGSFDVWLYAMLKRWADRMNENHQRGLALTYVALFVLAAVWGALRATG